MTPLPDALGPVEAFARERLKKADGPLVIGLCGAQGSGKSTLAAALSKRIANTVVLSLDDLYLPKSEREQLARTVHPLLMTRGVPGTHDVELGEAVLRELRGGETARLPCFDKAIDDRIRQFDWPTANGARLVLFEGWCVGARPQTEVELSTPVNVLECKEDSDKQWRQYVNNVLRYRYQSLFAVDALILLAAPSFDIVRQWRTEQEHHLAADIAAGRRQGSAMSDEEVARFIQFYERLTRHILHEMPGRADLTVRLDAERKVIR